MCALSEPSLDVYAAGPLPPMLELEAESGGAQGGGCDSVRVRLALRACCEEAAVKRQL